MTRLITTDFGFSGSYDPDDVTFLLRPVFIEPTPTVERERLMQSGEKHYSEMLPPESPPSKDYLDHYQATLERNGARTAYDVAALAEALRGRPVLVSLARAGTPIGALLRRFLKRRGVDAPHYSVSIIRGRGLDEVAMNAVIKAHGAEDIWFVDGWTSKGSIRKTLSWSIRRFQERTKQCLPDRLLVLADLAGVADLAATHDDYVIPSAILNAVVSGLVSRTVLNSAVVGPGQPHACRFYEEWSDHDLSRAFLDTIDRLDPGSVPPATWAGPHRSKRASKRINFIAEARQRWQIGDEHRIKPGIGEATRALLRRVPQCVAVRDLNHSDLAHLKYLCEQTSTPIEVWPGMPYGAVTVIRPVR